MRTRLTPFNYLFTITTLLLIMAFTILWALFSGVVHVTISDVFSSIYNWFGGNLEIDAFVEHTIIELRLKRILLALIVGMALSLSGCVFQALLRNPLADPHILGASAGGACGAVVATACGVSVLANTFLAVPILSFCGSLGAITLVYFLAKRKGVLSMYSLILIGVILNSFFISVVIFIESIISADQLASIFFWLLGNLSQFDNNVLLVLAVAFAVVFTILMFYARKINILSLGEEKAAQLGVSVEATKRVCFILAAVITGMSVAVSGLIGFVGLVVPHIMRLIFGPDHRLLLPASTIGGGIFLVVADTIARTALIPQELPVGVVTSFIGAPFFIFLLKQKEEKKFF